MPGDGGQDLQPRLPPGLFPTNLPHGTRISFLTRDRKLISPDPDLIIKDIEFKTRDDCINILRSYRRKSTTGRPAPMLVPLFLFLYGGGFTNGSLETEDNTCRTIAREIDVCVLSVEYRLAPEKQFPVGFEDCWEVLHWTGTNDGEETLKISQHKGLLLGGTDCGANFAAGLAQRYREHKYEPPISGLVLWAGEFCHPDEIPEGFKGAILSIHEVKDAPGLNRARIDETCEKYGAAKWDRIYSPLLFDGWRQTAKKAYFAHCGWDPRRDEGIIMANILKASEIKVKEHIYKGLPHAFWMMAPDMQVSRDWKRGAVAGIKWLLEA